MTLSEYLDLWLETYIDPKKAKNTGKSYRSALAHLSPEISAAELADLEVIKLQREINALEAVYSRQAQILFTVLRSALKRAVKLHLISTNPMNDVDPPNHTAKESEYLHQDEAAAYLREARKQPAGVLLILMLCLGLRRNEARGLRCGDLDEEGILHVEMQRTRDGLAPLKSKASRREIPVPEELRAFFSGPRGQWVADVSEKSLRNQHRKVLAAIGCERNVTLHGLRHTCATTALVNGVQLAQITKLLGHAHHQLTVDLYAHADLVLLRRCTNIVFGSFLSHIRQEGARLEIV
ncbi:MAG: site-specific integrase [Clostridia bacterium]|nr:site-specific integrase [Clostridia bacterium]